MSGVMRPGELETGWEDMLAETCVATATLAVSG